MFRPSIAGRIERAMSMLNLTLTVVRSHRLPKWSEFRAMLVEWRQRVLSRCELSMLDDRELWDMGLARMDAEQEADRPFWQA
jgi:uncharacterized protein YjiS (DUF1127 family)